MREETYFTIKSRNLRLIGYSLIFVVRFLSTIEYQCMVVLLRKVIFFRVIRILSSFQSWDAKSNVIYGNTFSHSTDLERNTAPHPWLSHIQNFQRNPFQKVQVDEKEKKNFNLMILLVLTQLFGEFCKQTCVRVRVYPREHVNLHVVRFECVFPDE